MKLLLPILLMLSLSACGVAQKAQYSALEQFGVHKRDILVDRIEKTSEAQEETKEQFQSAYDELSSLVSVDDQGLERKYKRMAKAVEESEAQAQELKDRTESVNRVATDLFAEWQEELELYDNPRLRQTSAENLATTKRRYAKLYQAMLEANSRVEPVLQVLQDNTLFLKHNLNARAVSSLSSEVVSIEGKVKALIRQMEASINESKSFIDSMN